jgi:hypothetical protein
MVAATVVASQAWGATIVFALTERVELAFVTGLFGFLSSATSAVLAYLNRQDIRKHRVEARRELADVRTLVTAPRELSTSSEEGPRLEPPRNVNMPEGPGRDQPL